MDLEQLGRRISSLRSRSGMSASALATKVNLSRGYLSRLENGHQIPSLATLDAMATVLGVRLEDFFSDDHPGGDRDVSISRAKELNVEVRPPAGFSYEPLTPSAVQHGFLPFLAVFAPGSDTRIDSHASAYFRYVLEGHILFGFGEDEYPFDAGDAFSYVADRVHHVRCLSDGPAKVLTIVQSVGPRPE